MKVRVVKVFGYEVLRIESHEEATVSDVVNALLAQRVSEEEEEYECCCGEEEEEDDEEVNIRFIDMTERIIWDARSEEDPELDEG
jgi:hypothetical protein